MTGDTVYELLLTYLRKDHRGNSIGIDQFNYLSKIVNERVTSFYCKKLEDTIDVSSEVGFLKVVGTDITLTSGVGALPADYRRIIGEPYYTNASLLADRAINVDVVSAKEYSFRQRNYLTQATTRYPMCQIGTQSISDALQIRVYPTSITQVTIDYLRDAVTPFLDYYITDANLATNYLTVGQTVTCVAGTGTYRDGTTGAKTSTTVDWEWTSSDLPLIIAFFLTEVGVVIPDTLLIEAGLKDKEELKSTE